MGVVVDIAVLAAAMHRTCDASLGGIVQSRDFGGFIVVDVHLGLFHIGQMGHHIAVASLATGSTKDIAAVIVGADVAAIDVDGGLACTILVVELIGPTEAEIVDDFVAIDNLGTVFFNGDRVIDFINFTQEIAHAIDYFIMKPNGHPETDIPAFWIGDISKWLKWFDNFLAGAITLLDGIELEDDTIDYDALLAQAKKELYDQLSPELHEALLLQIKDELREELTNSLSTTLREYMENTVKPELARVLSSELHETLYEKLYTELFEQLFNALYVPEQKEKEFIPLI
jgi:hypothetical protein